MASFAGYFPFVMIPRRVGQIPIRYCGSSAHFIQKEDISATLEDGVLILRIHLGPPLEPEQESEMIPIP